MDHWFFVQTHLLGGDLSNIIQIYQEIGEDIIICSSRSLGFFFCLFFFHARRSGQCHRCESRRLWSGPLHSSRCLADIVPNLTD